MSGLNEPGTPLSGGGAREDGRPNTSSLASTPGSLSPSEGGGVMADHPAPTPRERLIDLPTRTYHSRAELAEWGVVPPKDRGEWFAFIDVAEADQAAELAKQAARG